MRRGCGQVEAARGRDLGAALDLWVADELRRAGYEPDAAWPRTEEPRVLPAAIASAMGKLSKADQKSTAMQRLRERAGASAPVVLGDFSPRKSTCWSRTGTVGSRSW